MRGTHQLLRLLCLLAAVATAAASDLQKLLLFKSSLPGAGRRALPDWTPHGDPCTFTGVSCSNSRVASIRLDFRNLGGADFSSVAASLFAIDTLERLSLTGANVTGSLPWLPAPASRCGGRLVELDLAGNRLRGSAADVAYLATFCPSLRALNLSKNLLEFSSTASSAAVHAELVVLDLSFNRLADDGALPWLLNTMESLRYLDLSGNNISGWVPAVKNCSALRLLDLSWNALSAVGTRAFSMCTNLTSLDISHNNVSGELPPGFLGACPSLLHLDLSSNQLSGTVPSDFSSCPRLEYINLSSNNFSGDLPVGSPRGTPSLRTLDLSFNNFAGNLSGVPLSLPNVEVLDLSANGLSGSIPQELCLQLKRLKELYLQDNRLTGGIPVTLGNCSTLVSIDLSFNYLSGRIPSSIGSLPHLREIIMWENLLDGGLPWELKNLQALESLVLEHNRLTGPIPDGLSNCSNLKWISLSSNQLGGRVPRWIGQLSKLSILILGNNSFSGPIPPEMGDCKSLIWLDLHGNQLNGPIPPSLAKQSGHPMLFSFTRRGFAYLRGQRSNDCRGKGMFLSLDGIREGRLSDGPAWLSCYRPLMYRRGFDFNGSEPMIFLDISDNQLEGPIPPELGKMTQLMVLRLDHNNLSGPIPDELGRLKNMAVLYLDHNALQGPIPLTFSRLTLLSDIDLSNNNLNGMVPVTGQFPTFPAARFENNSGLCGFPLPPCWNAYFTPKTHHKLSKTRTIGVVVSVLSASVFLLGLLALYLRRKKRASEHKVPSSMEGPAPLVKVSYADLVKATDGFSSNNLIGAGSFGSVYKLVLDEHVYAVKVIDLRRRGALRSFTAECDVLRSIRHRNLLKVFTSCSAIDFNGNEFKALIFEFMPNASLETWLNPATHGDTGRKTLTFTQRLSIAIDVASALDYLHHHGHMPIVHCDLKPGNVLLDADMTAHVGDFGLSRFLSNPVNSSVQDRSGSIMLKGSIGYVAPEYGMGSSMTTLGDVYSYGILLMELFTGKRPVDEMFKDGLTLHRFVEMAFPGRVLDIVDPCLEPELSGEGYNNLQNGHAFQEIMQESFISAFKLGLSCSSESPKDRPEMGFVLKSLCTVRDGLLNFGLHEERVERGHHDPLLLSY